MAYLMTSDLRHTEMMTRNVQNAKGITNELDGFHRAITVNYGTIEAALALHIVNVQNDDGGRGRN